MAAAAAAAASVDSGAKAAEAATEADEESSGAVRGLNSKAPMLPLLLLPPPLPPPPLLLLLLLLLLSLTPNPVKDAMRGEDEDAGDFLAASAAGDATSAADEDDDALAVDRDWNRNGTAVCIANPMLIPNSLPYRRSLFVLGRHLVWCLLHCRLSWPWSVPLLTAGES